MADAINRNATTNRTLHPVVNEVAFRGDGRVEVVVAQLHLVADSQRLERFVGVDERIVHILRESRIVVWVDSDGVPLAATEAVRLTLVDRFVYHVPDVNLVLVVINQCSDVVLQPQKQQRLVGIAVRLRGHIDIVRIQEDPIRHLVVPDESVSAHFDVVCLGKRLNVVPRAEVEAAFRPLSRVPFQVIARRDAVVVKRSELTVRTHEILLQRREPNQEIRRISLRYGGNVLNHRRRRESQIEIVDVERSVWIVVRFNIQRERIVVEGEIIGCLQPHPGICSDEGVRDHRAEACLTCQTSLQTETDLRVGLSRRHLYPHGHLVA